MQDEYRRDYLLRLPLPLAQLYVRTYNAKSPRERHDNAFYLFEALIKLLAATTTAIYLEEVTQGVTPRVPQLDRMLAQLALPSLGQWLGILRELAKFYSQRVDAACHPWGCLFEQISRTRKDTPALLKLYQRIKNGPDGLTAGDQTCSLLQVLEALIQYRNGVFGHGAGRFESFYAEEMGPLLFPAINEALSEQSVPLLGTPGGRLVYITEVRLLDDGRTHVGLRELIGPQGERLAPRELAPDVTRSVLPNRVALLWPGRDRPLRLDPLLLFRESDLAEEVLFLNRDRNGRQVEYLSYTTGRTERDRSMLPALSELLTQVTNRPIDEHQWQALSEQSASETPSNEALLDPPPTQQQQLGEYLLLAELGRGGMGVVYLAQQRSLGRLVALKMLPHDLGSDEVAMARFRREIRHLARCDDPHIVKVLDSGTFPDGRLYYTMEYVPGSDLEMVWRELSGISAGSVAQWSMSTWAEAVLSASRKQRSKAEGSRGGHRTSSATVDPGPALPLQLPPLPGLPHAADDPGGYIRRVVTLARDVAQALHTIHQQGIVHRDIKPANLMLTPDGTRVVLMDFGLAKGTTQSLTASRHGGLLGTLRYAAPEQLAAANIKIGPAADVRGLGVTLWELLTRQRLFGNAEDEARLTQEVLTADVPRLRSIDPKFDRDLEAIVARATERRISDRISSAEKLAELLQLWLDGKPLPIRPPGTRELLWRTVCENAALVTALSLAFVLVVAVTIAAFMQVAAAKDRAEQALAAAQRQGELAMTTLQSVIYDLDNDLKNIPGAQRIRRQLLTSASDGLVKIGQDLQDDARVDVGKIKVHMELGRLFSQIGNADGLSGLEQADEQFHTASALCYRMLTENPDLAALKLLLSKTFLSRGNVLLQLGRLSDCEKQYEQALRLIETTLDLPEQEGFSPVSAQESHAECLARLGELHLQLRHLDQARDFFERSQAIRIKILKDHPSESQSQYALAVSHQTLGKLQLEGGQTQAARESFEQGAAIIQKLYTASPDKWRGEMAAVHSWLGQAELQLGHLNEAQQHFAERLAIADQIAQENPDDLESLAELSYACHWLGRAWLDAGQLDQAEKQLSRAADLMKKIAQADPKNMAIQAQLGHSQSALGDIVYRLGNLREAQVLYESNCQIFQVLSENQPDDATVMSNYSQALNSLGSVLLDLGNLKEALRRFQLSQSILEQLIQKQIGDATVQTNLAQAYRMAGQVVKLQANSAEALVIFRKGLEITEKIAQADPTNSEAQASLAAALDWTAQTLFDQGELAEARALFIRENHILEKLVAANPTSSTTQMSLAITYRWLGRVALRDGDYAGAKQAFLQDLQITQRLAEASPDDARAQSELSYTYNWLERTSIDHGDLPMAIEYGRKCVDILEKLVARDPSNNNMKTELLKAHSLLGEAYLNQKETALAKSSFEKSLQIVEELDKRGVSHADINQSRAWIFNNLAELYLANQDPPQARHYFEESRLAFDKLAKADPQNLDVQRGLAQGYRGLGRAELANNDYAAAVEWLVQELPIWEQLHQEHPTQADLEMNLGYSLSWIGSTYWQQKDVKQALPYVLRWREIAERRYEQFPSSAQAKSDLISAVSDCVTLLQYDQRLPEAIAAWNRWVELAPEIDAVWNIGGNLHFAAQNWATAVEHYTRAIGLTPRNHVYLHNRANTLVKQQQWELAQADIDAALALAPGNEVYQKVAAEIAKSRNASAPENPETTPPPSDNQAPASEGPPSP